jgi:hypothetical protein
VRTAAVAAFSVLVVAATGFSLQAAGLRRIPRANVVAARAATLLLDYRFATSTLHLGDRIVHGRCFHGWYEASNERPARGTLLVLDNGSSVQTIDSRPVRAQDIANLLPESTLELAGCTKILGDRVAALAQFDDHIRLAATEVFGRPALAVRFERLTLLVSPKTDRPLGVSFSNALSSIRLVPVTPRVSRAFASEE